MSEPPATPSYGELAALVAEQTAQLAEQAVLIKALRVELEALRRQVGRDSSNSSQPPSTDGPGAKAKAKAGGGATGRDAQPSPHVDRLAPETAERVAQVLDGFGGQWVAATTVEQAAVPDVLLRRFAVTVTIRPLRHRIDDVRELVPALLRKLAPGQEICCGHAAMRILLRSQWPGNIAELVTVLRTALGRRRTGEITPKDLPEFCHTTSRHVLTPWETLERDAIVRTLLDAGGDRPKAAAMLGISRATIYRKITAYGIVVDPGPRRS